MTEKPELGTGVHEEIERMLAGFAKVHGGGLEHRVTIAGKSRIDLSALTDYTRENLLMEWHHPRPRYLAFPVPPMVRPPLPARTAERLSASEVFQAALELDDEGWEYRTDAMTFVAEEDL